MKPVDCPSKNYLLDHCLWAVGLLAAMLTGFIQPPAVRAQERPVAPVSVRSLLPEMADLTHLAESPQLFYKVAQVSSHDRASTSPANPAGWFANRDYGHFLYVETHGKRQEQVMMDADGPGAVVRIWVANPEGTLRVYLDGAGQPALEASMEKLLSGKVPPFSAPLGHLASQGYNLYFPIPYAQHCKITAELDKPDNLFYNVMFRTYPQGTPVETFTLAGLDDLNGEIQQTIDQLNRPAYRPTAQARHVETQLQTIGNPNAIEAPGGLLGGMVRELRLKPGRTDLHSLRQTQLEISFDGQAPTVVAPLGDFFGGGPGLNANESLPFSVYTDGQMVCRWPMPFKKSVRVRLSADPATTGTTPMAVTCALTIEPYKFVDRSLIFHARWRADHQLAPHGFRDWNFATLNGGPGVFVGNALNVANPFTGWWGEGDEKVYLDGEAHPSIFGTGSEDYFGYAWCSNKLFKHPYHAQTRCDGPANYGHTTVNRWQVLDALPFRQSLRFDLEQMTVATAKKGVLYDAVSYWYAAPGGRDNFPALKPAALTLPLIPRLSLRAVTGAIEAEKLKTETASGQVESQPMEAHTDTDRWWSYNSQLWWHGAHTGERLTITFDAPATARYRVMAYLTTAPDYGIHQLSVNGKPTGKPFDFWGKEPRPTGPVDLGIHELKTLGNELGVQAIGANKQAQPGNMFGLDCLVLIPIETAE